MTWIDFFGIRKIFHWVAQAKRGRQSTVAGFQTTRFRANHLSWCKGKKTIFWKSGPRTKTKGGILLNIKRIIILGIEFNF
jgi:hypothetical protein